MEKENLLFLCISNHSANTLHNSKCDVWSYYDILSYFIYSKQHTLHPNRSFNTSLFFSGEFPSTLGAHGPFSGFFPWNRQKTNWTWGWEDNQIKVGGVISHYFTCFYKKNTSQSQMMWDWFLSIRSLFLQRSCHTSPLKHLTLVALVLQDASESGFDLQQVFRV